MKWFLLLFFSSLHAAQPVKDSTLNFQSVRSLGYLFGIEKDFIPETQRLWIRKKEQERWDLKELHQDQKEMVLSWAEKEGLFSEKMPQFDRYDIALILGAATPTMKIRLDYLLKLFENNVTFSQIVWLTGDRPLDPAIDDLIDKCLDETQAAEFLWDQIDPTHSIKKIPTLFIKASKLNKEQKRPTTFDTLTAWIKTNPSSSKLLFISNEPFCDYQSAVIETALPDNIVFDVVGPSCDRSTYPNMAAVILDTVARWAYQKQMQ